ncbi:Craniofacial development protein 2 [Eumeta japonica]|uniref:Craniofacial development protein 2 n=1 Tax=Eumeta variegata TaxID=151549 RepID=A0A4C1YG53_EUMVA|nr:Craniofacial development protein 2 [Eumeta japonica]
MQQKKALNDTDYYLKDDYPYHVLQKRKMLQEQVKIELEKGNKAIIKYDKLVVLKHNKTDADHTDNRKSTLSANKHNKELNKNEFLHLPSRPVTEEDYDQNLPTILLKTNSSTKENNLINQLYITTYNVRTLSSQERLIELTEALKNVKNDIIGLCEVRRLGSKITEYENFIFCHTGESPGKYGVGFIIKKYLKQYLESYIGLSERVALLHLSLPGKKLTIIQIYAPTEAADEEEIVAFYETTYKAIEIAHKDFILMGDFNAKIGEPQNDEQLVMKQNGYGQRNIRGQRLVDFALENKLAIINTFFQEKPKKKMDLALSKWSI